MMLEQICAHIHNYFVTDADVFSGSWTIAGGQIDLTGVVLDGQYYRIVNSRLNDGVYKRGEDTDLSDETFEGEIQPMRVPKAVLELAGEIEAWQTQYGAVMASPYQSENVIGVYSYAKGGGSGDGGASADAWKTAFRTRMNPWRKLR